MPPKMSKLVTSMNISQYTQIQLHTQLVCEILHSDWSRGLGAITQKQEFFHIQALQWQFKNHYNLHSGLSLGKSIDKIFKNLVI